MEQQGKNLQLIQVLRGIASLLVVCYHATMSCAMFTGEKFAFNYFSFGFTGVDIFFVLSGFIITYTSLKYITQPGKWPVYIKRRFVRIFPVYWIIITIFLLLQVVLLISFPGY